jgi:hypothetical protein
MRAAGGVDIACADLRAAGWRAVADPHSRLFDFSAAGLGADWIDGVARLARERMTTCWRCELSAAAGRFRRLAIRASIPRFMPENRS